MYACVCVCVCVCVSVCVCVGVKAAHKKTYALAPKLALEIGVEQVHAATGFGDNSPTTPFLSENVALTGRVHAEFSLPLLVVSVAGQEAMKNITVARGVHSVRDLFNIKRKRLATLIRVVKTVLNHERQAAANQRARARLPRTRHQARHTLLFCVTDFCVTDTKENERISVCVLGQNIKSKV